MNKLIIKAKVDERVFKKDDTIELTGFGVNFIVGPNGCGKSTILHAIRAYRDSLYENMKPNIRMEFARNHDLCIYKDVFDVQGLDEYKYVFCLDAHLDNPVSFMNAGSATALIHSGGLQYGHISRGQGSQMMMSRFITDMQNMMNVKITDSTTWPPSDRSLIVIDELDEGLDLNGQMKFHRLLWNLSRIFNADVICVCHNPLCILTSAYTNVYDMSTRSYKDINTYIKEQTGKVIIIKDIDDDKN